MAHKQSTEPEPVPIQPVDSPILCSPYDEPAYHWVYDLTTGEASKADGRRPASYYDPHHRQSDQQLRFGEFQEETRNELDMVNRLRADVKRWREADYRNATGVTKTLLRHWTRADAERRLFFCQREAVETVIFLLEIVLPGKNVQFALKTTAEDLAYLKDEDLLRLGCKMATGSGKTVVMAMVIAWSLLNHVQQPTDPRFAGAVLVCCPNLTVKERLQVLRPELPDNYYDQFRLIPTNVPPLPPGRVLINNWHQFALESEHADGGSTYGVVQKGEESPEAFSRRLLGNLVEHTPLLVLNDEGHHAYRPRPLDEKEALGLTAEEKAEREEATLWVQGLDRFQRAVGVRAVVDLSATPFYIQGSGHPEGKPFPWLTSDFGLVDAIESGIVKIPRLPIVDTTGRPDARYYRLWRNIVNELPPSKFVGGKSRGRPKPEAVFERGEDALETLTGQWKERFEAYQQARPGQEIIPPVLIVVCADTNLAQFMFERISGEREEEVIVPARGGKTKKEKQRVYGQGLLAFPEFWNSDAEPHRTVRIDSQLLASAESATTTNRQEAAEELRQMVATVGKVGEPGEQIRCVVAVSMLNEGWDANNVTHILGLRAFGSQLLCEQVVGRALRRMDYSVNPETGFLEPEYADIYGIPFTLIPFKGKSTRTPEQEPPRNHVRAIDARKHFEIRFPMVEGYTLALQRNLVECNVAACEATVIRPEELPTKVSVGPDFIFGNAPLVNSPMLSDDQDREQFWDSIHFQQIEYAIARELLNRLTGHAGGQADTTGELMLKARHQLFPQVLSIVRRYVEQRVNFRGARREELALEVYTRRVLDLLQQAIRPVDASDGGMLLPILSRWRQIGTTDSVNFKTKRPCHPTQHSHIDQVVLDTGTWERSAAFYLEASQHVAFYARNDAPNEGGCLTMPYAFDDDDHVYIPDFLVRLNDEWESVLVLEVKGRQYPVTPVKHEAARRWRDAVNNLQGWNKRIPRCWRFWATYDVQKLDAELAQIVKLEPGQEDRLVGD